MMTLTIATTTDRTKTTCATPDTPTQDDHNYYGIGDGNDNQRQGPCVESMDHHETTTENSDKDLPLSSSFGQNQKKMKKRKKMKNAKNRIDDEKTIPSKLGS